MYSTPNDPGEQGVAHSTSPVFLRDALLQLPIDDLVDGILLNLNESEAGSILRRSRPHQLLDTSAQPHTANMETPDAVVNIGTRVFRKGRHPPQAGRVIDIFHSPWRCAVCWAVGKWPRVQYTGKTSEYSLLQVRQQFEMQPSHGKFCWANALVENHILDLSHGGPTLFKGPREELSSRDKRALRRRESSKDLLQKVPLVGACIPLVVLQINHAVHSALELLSSRELLSNCLAKRGQPTDHDAAYFTFGRDEILTITSASLVACSIPFTKLQLSVHASVLAASPGLAWRVGLLCGDKERASLLGPSLHELCVQTKTSVIQSEPMVSSCIVLHGPAALLQGEDASAHIANVRMTVTPFQLRLVAWVCREKGLSMKLAQHISWHLFAFKTTPLENTTWHNTPALTVDQRRTAKAIRIMLPSKLLEQLSARASLQRDLTAPVGGRNFWIEVGLVKDMMETTLSSNHSHASRAAMNACLNRNWGMCIRFAFRSAPDSQDYFLGGDLGSMRLTTLLVNENTKESQRALLPQIIWPAGSPLATTGFKLAYPLDPPSSLGSLLAKRSSVEYMRGRPPTRMVWRSGGEILIFTSPPVAESSGSFDMNSGTMLFKVYLPEGKSVQTTVQPYVST